MGSIFGGGDSGPSGAELAKQETERKRLEDIETRKKNALKRRNRGRASLISGEATGEKAENLGGK